MTTPVLSYSGMGAVAEEKELPGGDFYDGTHGSAAGGAGGGGASRGLGGKHGGGGGGAASAGGGGGKLSPTTSHMDPDDDSNVTLSPWTHEQTPLVIAIVAIVIQCALLGLGIWLAVDPVILPSSNYVFGSLSLKSFNVIITVAGSVVCGIAGAAITVGSRSHLSRGLVEGGITLKEYERWFAVGNGATVSLTSTNGILPLAMFLLSTGASSAINGVFAAGTDSTTTNQIQISYTGVPDSLSTLDGLPLYNRQDFEGFVFDFRQNILLQQVPNATITEVDGTRSSVGTGIVPTIYEISTLTSRILLPNGPGELLAEKTRKVIGSATANQYTFSAPTAQSVFTCGPASMTASTPTAVAPNYVSFTVTDPTCGASAVVFDNVNSASVGAYTCLNAAKQAYIGYYSLNANTSEFKALAACTGTVNVGTASNMAYWDSQIGNPSSYNLSLPIQLANVTDYSGTAVQVLTDNWVKTFGSIGSPALTELLGTPKYTQDLGLLSGAPYYSAVEVLTNGLMSMSLAKLMNSATIFNSYFNTTTPTTVGQMYQTGVESPSVIIGPIGYNKLWLAVFGLSLVTLVQALRFVIKYRPTPLNPLDPVSVLLVAQNSPPTHLADGGCLGSREQIRSPEELITYRAVNAVHLAFVWGPSYYEPPVVGRMYGKLGKKDE